MDRDNINLLQSFLRDETFGSIREDFEKINEDGIAENICSGNYQVIDSRFQYKNCQIILETKTSSGSWLVSLTKGFGSKEYGTRSLMNDFFHLARLKAQNDGDKVAGLAIVYRDQVKDNDKHSPLMSLRAQAALAVLKNWPNIQQGPLAVSMEASTYSETYKMEVGAKESEKELEDKLKDKLNAQKDVIAASSQLRVRLLSRTGKEKNTSLAMDLVIMQNELVEVLELKKDYLGREAFVELLQNAYFPLSFSGKMKDLFKDIQDSPIAEIPDKEKSKEFKEKSEQAKTLVLRGVGKGYPVGACKVGYEFDLMQQQLLDNRKNTDVLQILFI